MRRSAAAHLGRDGAGEERLGLLSVAFHHGTKDTEHVDDCAVFECRPSSSPATQTTRAASIRAPVVPR